MLLHVMVTALLWLQTVEDARLESLPIQVRFLYQQLEGCCSAAAALCPSPRLATAALAGGPAAGLPARRGSASQVSKQGESQTVLNRGRARQHTTGGGPDRIDQGEGQTGLNRGRARQD